MRRLFHPLRPGASDTSPGAATASRTNHRSRVDANTISATQPTTTLHDAATKGLTETVARLLDQGVAVDHFNAARATPLHLAIKEGHVDIVRLLLSSGASIEAPYGPILLKPLHLAAMTLNPAMMEAVLRHKPNLESRHDGLTPLYFAVGTGDVAVVRLLLDAGADIYARTTSESGTGESVLHMACASFKTAMVAFLIRCGADVNVIGTNPKGQTALHIAAQYGNAEAVTELIAAGANMYAKFPDKRTALEVAAQNGRIKTVEAFIKHGMDPLANFDGRANAIYMAVIHGKTDMSRWFVDRYADRMDHNTKINLVIGAAGENRIKILEMLDEKGFPIIEYDDRGVGPLFVALLNQHKDAIVFLLRRGVDFEPHIPGDPNSWVAKDPNYQPGLELLRSARSQLQAQPDAKLFPDWQFRDPEWDSSCFQAQIMAALASVNATRRIQANQEPAGIFTCQVCHDLDFRRGMNRDAEIVYFIGMRSLESTASRCNGCHFLIDCLEGVRKGYGERVWAAMSSEYLALYSAAEGAPLLADFHDGNAGLTPSRRIEIYVNEGT
jgi:ankyrin repeat protein